MVDTPRLDVEMFRGSKKLGPGLSVLRALPAWASSSLLAALSIGDGVRRGRYRQARMWAAAQGASAVASRWIAVQMLANHGRFAAEEALLGVRSLEALGASVVLEGAEQLERITGGALLLGFHLGPPRTWLMLRALGRRVSMAARFENAVGDPRWAEMLKAGDIIPLPEADGAARLQALYRIRALLGRNTSIFMTADGPLGREAFRLPLPGMPLIVRAGWLSLRRQTRVPTFPVLAHEEAGRRVIVIFPPLPAPVDDPVADAEACRAALTPLVAEYVRRFPTQCRYLVFPRWAGEARREARTGR